MNQVPFARPVSQLSAPSRPRLAPSRGARIWQGVKKVLARFKPPRRLKLTREGKYYILITFGVGFVGILTANNLLYVLLGVLLSLIVVSGLLSEASLKGLRVTRRLPLRAQVGRPHLVEIEVHNEKKRMPSYAIEVEDLRSGQPADKRCFFLKVSPSSSQVAAYRRVPARRGLEQHVGFRVATRFPFGFFEKSRELSLSGDLIIYPAVDQIQLPRPLGGPRSPNDGSTVHRGSGDDIWGLRVMREGDDPRDIYWKRSRVSGPKVVMERASEAQGRVRLQLDNVFVGDSPNLERQQLFERQVRDVASLAVSHLRRGERVTISAKSRLDHVSSPAEGADSTLRFLALIELASDAPDGASHTGANVHFARDPQRTGKSRSSHSVPVVGTLPLSSPAEVGEIEVAQALAVEAPEPHPDQLPLSGRKGEGL